MPRLSDSLRFYVKHAVDVGALWGEDEKPDGVAPDEWAVFGGVLGELKADADALLRRLFAPLETGVVAGFVVAGRKAYKVHENWDYHRQFKTTGKGDPDPVGYAGVQIVDEPGGESYVVVFVTALDFSKPDAAYDRCPDKLKKLLTDRLVIASVKLNDDTDEDVLAQAVVGAAADISAALVSLSG